MNKKNLVYTLGLAFVMQFCTYNQVEVDQSKLPQLVSYKNDIQPMFEKNCFDCHDGNSYFPKLNKEESYSELIYWNHLDTADAEKSKLIVKLRNNHPSPGIPSEKEMSVLIKWIEQGGKNN